MPETKTRREWLNELPEPYRSEAISNTAPILLDIKNKSLWLALSGAFIFDYSPQGKKYWENVRKELCTPPTDK